MRIVFSLIFTLFAVAAQAQTGNDKQANSFEPFEQKESAAQKRSMKKKGKKSARAMFNKHLDVKKKEYDKRMQANAKEAKKMRREMEKPQYSDPSYFGHKKKPKKRPPGKRKFCKECGIWH